VIGISGGSDKTKASFCKKHSLKVSLLSDPDFKVAKTYGAFGPKKFMGRSYEGIFRKTFVIDRAGKIVHIFDSVKPEGHAQEVLALLSQLKKSTSPRASAVKKPAPPRKVSAKTSKNKKVSAPKKKGSKRG
jgi:peroxiredoxin Q/BCP